MQKDKKSKKRSIDELHDILDEASYKELPSENKKYFKSLDMRLKKSSDDAQVYRKIVKRQMGEEEVSLEPKVTIHIRGGRRRLEFPEIKKEEIITKMEPIPTLVLEEPEKKPIKDEDLIEIEKVEYKGPQFVEVKPKVIIKEELQKAEKKAIGDEGLTEWEPVDKKDDEKLEWESLDEGVFTKTEEKPPKKPIKEFLEAVKKIESVSGFCGNCGAKLVERYRFCPSCGHDLEAEFEEEIIEEKPEPMETLEPEQTFVPVKIVKEKDESLKPEYQGTIREEEEKEEVSKEGEYFISIQDKVEVFKDIISIDKNTAVLLYDKGFTTIFSIKQAKISILTKITGISKKLVKKIKKEVDKKIKELAKIVPAAPVATISEEKLEDLIKQDVLSKAKEEPAPVELLTKTSEWEPTLDIESEEFDEQKREIKEAKEIFKDIKSIDDETALLLYENGYSTLEDLRFATVKDLSKIKGIKKKKAVEIKKEIDLKPKPYDIVLEKPAEEAKFEEVKIEEEKETEVEVVETDVFEEVDESTSIDVDKKILEKEEPIKTEGDGFFDEKFEGVPLEKEDETENIFKDIPSIDNKISKLLIENGIDSVEILNNKTVKDLTKIRGIKKKVAKKIKKDVENLFSVRYEESETATFKTIDEQFIKEDAEEWDSFDEKKVGESVKREFEGFMHGDYTLYEKEIETKSGKKRTIRFFSKAQPEDGVPIELPKGFEVKENKKTGFPYLKKKK